MNDLITLTPERQRELLRSSFLSEFAQDAIIVEAEPVSAVNFLDANTNSITLEELERTCVVPTWGDMTPTIPHQDFIRTVVEAARDFYQGEEFSEPQIRVSHIIKGRTPNALHKKASELLDCEKTQFYQRLAFAMTIPTIYETINGEKLQLCIGAIRNYNDLNLYRQSQSVEKFSVFVGWRVNVCSNQVLTGQGVKMTMEVMSLRDLYSQCLDLFNNYNPAKDIHLMQSLTSTYLNESQFAQIVGRMRLYQALPSYVQKSLPRLLITDSQINNVCRDYFSSKNFGAKDNLLSMWDFHNLLTESNKSSYIDSYLSRAVNATEIAVGIANALKGDPKYAWFLG